MNPSVLPPAAMHLLDRLPGRVQDRKTPLGALNWIYQSITDTIAWEVLDRPLFHRAFRQVRCPPVVLRA